MMKKVLIFYGGWDGHEPKKTAELMAETLEENKCSVELADNQEVLLDTEKLAECDLIVPNWTMGEISGDKVGNLARALENGCGMGGWHGGMGDAFRQNAFYQFITGGQFVDHPGGIREFTVNIKDKEHPVTKGMRDFQMKSEQYYMHVDPSNHVLATTAFDGKHHPWIEGCVMPAAWTRRWGRGKIFYTSLGHVAKDFEVPEALEITRRGLLWACR